MIRVEKIMFHAIGGYSWKIQISLTLRNVPMQTYSKMEDLIMKKLLVFMMIVTFTLSLTACGEDNNSAAPTDTTSSSSVADTSKPDDLVAVTGNGLSFGLPIDIKYVKTDENNGG